MRLYRSFSVIVLIAPLLLSLTSVGTSAQSSQPASNPKIAVASPLPNGIEVRLGDLREKIVALRDDVLRITGRKMHRGPFFPTRVTVPSRSKLTEETIVLAFALAHLLLNWTALLSNSRFAILRVISSSRMPARFALTETRFACTRPCPWTSTTSASATRPVP